MNFTPNTQPPPQPGSTEPPRASSEIHSAPTGARGLDGQRSSTVPGKVETIGSESLPAVFGAISNPTWTPHPRSHDVAPDRADKPGRFLRSRQGTATIQASVLGFGYADGSLTCKMVDEKPKGIAIESPAPFPASTLVIAPARMRTTWWNCVGAASGIPRYPTGREAIYVSGGAHASNPHRPLPLSRPAQSQEKEQAAVLSMRWVLVSPSQGLAQFRSPDRV